MLKEKLQSKQRIMRQPTFRSPNIAHPRNERG